MSKLNKEDRAADLRLRRTYGITLAEYNQQLKRQAGGCAICGRFPKRLRLAVDHNHKVAQAKVTATKHKKQWIAVAFQGVHGRESVSSSPKRALAVKTVRDMLKRQSVRALLCMICNRKVLGVMERFKVRPGKVEQYLRTYDPLNELVSQLHTQGANV